MTDKPVDLNAKRKEKQGRCAFCGEPTHDFLGQCSRISAVTEETDGSCTYHLSHNDEPPLAG